MMVRKMIMRLLSKEAALEAHEFCSGDAIEDSVWCGRGDLNPHAFWAPPPQDGVSANFTTSAIKSCFIFNYLPGQPVRARATAPDSASTLRLGSPPHREPVPT